MFLKTHVSTLRRWALWGGITCSTTLLALKLDVFHADTVCAYAREARAGETEGRHPSESRNPGSSKDEVLTFKFGNQVGGHGISDNKPSVLRLASDRTIILKPLGRGYKGEVERRFYADLDQDDNLRSLVEYVPHYIGYARLPHPNPHKNDTLGYVILEDETARFSKPCIIDIKVGVRTFDDYAPATKVRTEIRNHIAQSTIGYRITGMRVYDPVTETYEVYGKQYGRALGTPEQVQGGLCTFFRYTNELLDRRRLIETIESILPSNSRVQCQTDVEGSQAVSLSSIDAKSAIEILKMAQVRAAKRILGKSRNFKVDANSTPDEIFQKVSAVLADQELLRRHFHEMRQALGCPSPEQRIRDQLTRLLSHLETYPTHNFYAASVLLAYEGDPNQYLMSCLSPELKREIQRLSKQSTVEGQQSTTLSDSDHVLHSLPVTFSKYARNIIHSGQRNDATTALATNQSVQQRTDLATTIMIDFAHTYKLVPPSEEHTQTRISSAKHYADTSSTSLKLAEQTSAMFTQTERDTSFIEGLRKLVQDMNQIADGKVCAQQQSPLPLCNDTSLPFYAKLLHDLNGGSKTKTLSLDELKAIRPIHYLADLEKSNKTVHT